MGQLEIIFNLTLPEFRGSPNGSCCIFYLFLVWSIRDEK